MMLKLSRFRFPKGLKALGVVIACLSIIACLYIFQSTINLEIVKFKNVPLFTSNNQTYIQPNRVTTRNPAKFLSKEVNQKREKVLEKDKDLSLLTSCEKYEKLALFEDQTSLSSTNLTIEQCRSQCANKDTVYATLTKGACFCFNENLPMKIVDMEKCNVTCQGQGQGCDPVSLPDAITMRTGLRDGNRDWTPWMFVYDLNVKVRYRYCDRSKSTKSKCLPEFQKLAVAEKTPLDPESRYLIGCFTEKTIMLENGFPFIKISGENLGNVSSSCRDFCKRNQSKYSILKTSSKNKLTCHCRNSLALSRPSNSCPENGLIILFTQDKPITLEFEGEVRKTGKVLVLGRYRSGSSTTQALFVRNPNSFTLFEPGKMKISDFESDLALVKAFEAFYRCDVTNLPHFFYSSMLMVFSYNMLTVRGQDQNNYKEVQDCFKVKPPIDCAPVWQEACESSSFLNVKTIRLFTSSVIQWFVGRNKDVHVVHLMRDPKSLIFAQKVMGQKNTKYKDLCNEMVSIGNMIANMKQIGYKNIHEVFYEELALNSSYYGARLYREMNLEMPESVRTFLNERNYSKDTIPRSVQEVVVADPTYHIYRFLERVKDPAMLLDIDEQCEDVYSLWPNHYQNISTMYKYHKEEMKKYIPKSKELKFFTQLNLTFSS